MVGAMHHLRDILIFANPISGQGRGVAIAKSIARAASAAGHRVRCFTEHPAGTPEETLPAGGQGVVIAIGGDGTLRAVTDRLLATSAPELPPVIVVPLGTANLVARHLHCHWPEHEIGLAVVRAIHANRRRHLDLSSVNGHAMLAVAGVGFDAQVVHELAARRRGPISYAHYLLPTLRSLAQYSFAPLSVMLDGREILHATPAIAFVGNIAEYGAGFSVTPKAKSDDGLLDLCLLPCRSWRDIFELGVLCGLHHQVSHERAIYQRGRHIEITSPRPVPLQIDGDESGFTPVTIDLLPRRLTFIVPPKA